MNGQPVKMTSALANGRDIFTGNFIIRTTMLDCGKKK
jgi:hypothetical protein